MTIFHLIRHAAHAHDDDVLFGRMSGIELSPSGREQARALAKRLAGCAIDGIQSSPRQRARETAAEIAAPHGLPVEIVPAVDEMDYGLWTGRSFSALRTEPAWRLWNEARSASRPPGGESMAEARSRLLAHLRGMHERAPGGCFVIVSHAEILRIALLHCLGRSFDEFASIAVPLAGSTILRWERGELCLATETVPLIRVAGPLSRMYRWG
jgi:probable phosphoglycerate mutase